MAVITDVSKFSENTQISASNNSFTSWRHQWRHIWKKNYWEMLYVKYSFHRYSICGTFFYEEDGLFLVGKVGPQ